jgi:hypothetical protein
MRTREPLASMCLSEEGLPTRAALSLSSFLHYWQSCPRPSAHSCQPKFEGLRSGERNALYSPEIPAHLNQSTERTQKVDYNLGSLVATRIVDLQADDGAFRTSNLTAVAASMHALTDSFSFSPHVVTALRASTTQGTMATTTDHPLLMARLRPQSETS